MDPALYRAAQLGNWDVIKQFESQLYSQQTSESNNVLHILARFCDSSFAVEQILKAKPKLLLKSNTRREIALHIAARKGHSNVVRALIDCAKGQKRCSSLLRSRDEDGNLALHVAVGSNCYDIVQLLVEADPVFSHGRNDAAESPLYVASEKGYRSIAELILSTCKSPSHAGPKKRTALHAAAIGNFQECMQLLLEKLPHLAKEVDTFGCTALHYATRFNHRELVIQLLLANRSTVYVKCCRDLCIGKNDRWKTALHIPVTYGHIDVIKELLSSSPDCWDALTFLHQNILHLTVKNEQNEVLDFILNQFWAEDLINQKDRDGNTPIHLYATTKNLLGHDLINHPKVDINALNDTGLTPLDMVIVTEKLTERQTSIKSELERAGATPGLQNVISLASDSEVLQSEHGKDLAKMANTYLIVSTLIITVTFAAGFTLPGGYYSNEGPRGGTAILAKKADFIVFIISDLLAMKGSVCAVISVFIFQRSRTGLQQLARLDACRSHIGIALAAMIVAMVTGLYAVLPTLGMKIFLLVCAAWFSIDTLGTYFFRTRSFLQSYNPWSRRNSKAKVFILSLWGTRAFWFAFKKKE